MRIGLTTGWRYYFNCNKSVTLATAPRAITAAAMASPTSSPLTRFTAGACGRGAGVGDGGRDAAGPVEVGGRVIPEVPPAEGALVAGRGAAGAPNAAGAPDAAVPVVGAAGAGAAAVGTDGSLMVGAADGFGGKLMRTVSFFG